MATALSKPGDQANTFNAGDLVRLADLTADDADQPVTAAGVLTAVTVHQSAQGRDWAEGRLSDGTGSVTVFLFPNTHETFGHLFTDDARLVVAGRVHVTSGLEFDGHPISDVPCLMVQRLYAWEATR